MRIPGPGEKLTVEQLAMLISIAMAADGRHAPILRGKHAADRPTREKFRDEFSGWVAARILASNVEVRMGKVSSSTSLSTGRVRGTPPQLRANMPFVGELFQPLQRK